MVQLSKGNINKESFEKSDAVKVGDFGMISGYSKENKVPETTNVKIDFSLENLDLSELRGKATYEQIMIHPLWLNSANMFRCLTIRKNR